MSGLEECFSPFFTRFLFSVFGYGTDGRIWRSCLENDGSASLLVGWLGLGYVRIYVYLVLDGR